jgi:hypothetical protein
VTDRFQDGRRHVRNSSECYKMDNYHPILMQIGTQTKKTCSLEKSQKRKCGPNFKIAAAALLEIEERAIKWAITTRF